MAGGLGSLDGDVDWQFIWGRDADVHISGKANVVDFTAFEKPVYVVLHLFSGRRRHEDLQCQLEWVTAHSDYTLMTLSLDITVDADLGDLSSSAAVRYWVTQVRGGRVVGAVAGPPCETWSVVRFMLQVDET